MFCHVFGKSSLGFFIPIKDEGYNNVLVKHSCAQDALGDVISLSCANRYVQLNNVR